jgi:hypothetical protein
MIFLFFACGSVPLWGDDLLKFLLFACGSVPLWGDDLFVIRLRLGAIVGR